MTRLRATPHPGPLCGERFRREISPIEPLNRSNREEARFSKSEIRNPKSEIDRSLLTSAATRFLVALGFVAMLTIGRTWASGSVSGPGEDLNWSKEREFWSFRRPFPQPQPVVKNK